MDLWVQKRGKYLGKGVRARGRATEGNWSRLKSCWLCSLYCFLLEVDFGILPLEGQNRAERVLA